MKTTPHVGKKDLIFSAAHVRETKKISFFSAAHVREGKNRCVSAVKTFVDNSKKKLQIKYIVLYLQNSNVL
jgi:hypothetical protein